MNNAERYFQKWIHHRLVLHDILDLLEDKDIHFKPWDNAMPMGALVLHTASATDMFVKGVKNGSFTFPPTVYPYQTVQDVKDKVHCLTEESKGDFHSLDDQKLAMEIDFNSSVAKGGFWLSAAIDHEIHHKGQLFTYARIAGVEKLPFFIKQPAKE